MSIEELIEDLEMIRRKLGVRELSPDEYEAVGWADRPLRQLIDQCRDESESRSWVTKHLREFAALDPRLALPEPLPLGAEP